MQRPNFLLHQKSGVPAPQHGPLRHTLFYKSTTGSAGILDGGLCVRRPGGRWARGREQDVQTYLVAELHAGGVAAVFAADAQAQVGAGGAAQLCGHFHQLAHAVLIQVGNGSLVHLVIVVVAEELAASSRLKPKVIWVRSLVPKLKNSASLAISSAVRAARGI